MRRALVTYVLVCVCWPACIAAVKADEVEERLDEARRHLEAGKVKKAVAAVMKAGEAAAVDQKARTLGQGGTLLAQAGKLEESLPIWKAAVKADDKYFIGHANIGQINQLLGRHSEALEGFSAAAKLQPDNGPIRTKLVQIYQALGRTKDRDRERAAVFDLKKKGSLEGALYCRDQFAVGPADKRVNVMAFEYFELTGERAVRYSFQVLDPATGKPKSRISLGSYETTTQIARETGAIPKDGRMFHLDLYLPDGSHATFGMYKIEPAFEEVKKNVVAIIEGKLDPKSSSRAQKKP